ncbi:hypothetical protein GJ496_007252 [Pomphorhynchus laevis]|nr:hypothetical protein GJ496_007252 [Pomphorhynchus laevis]
MIDRSRKSVHRDLNAKKTSSAFWKCVKNLRCNPTTSSFDQLCESELVIKLKQLNNGTIETPKSSLLSHSQYCNEFYEGVDALISMEDITSALHRLPKKVSYGP